jgi:phosphohistidine phosphatase SixA
MKLYLARHGEAVSDLEDPKRPLSAAGRADVERVARQLAAVAEAWSAVMVRHSPKLRAAQTAEILCAWLKPAERPREMAGLNPGDPPQAALEFIESAGGDTMLVGHLPHLGLLASQLLSGDPQRVQLDFQGACVLCLARLPNARWGLEWMLAPRIASPQPATKPL